jgi:cytochrome b pre-mRNA-processing protein 3
MMLNALRRSKERRALAARLHAGLVTRARDPVFFARFGVADTLDGRFDLVVLHAWLVLERLTTASAALSQAFVDAVFVGFDEALRELGAGDIGMGKRLKKLAGAFYGRMRAYEEAHDETAMEAALVRNLYRGTTQAGARTLARYVMGAKARLEACDVESGVLDFGPLPDEDLALFT